MSGARTRLGRKGREGDQLEGREPAFEMLVLGCGGGPVGSNLSSYLVKPRARKWSDGCTGLEGGSTLGAIVALAERHPDLFAEMELEHELDARTAARRRRVRATMSPGGNVAEGARPGPARGAVETERQRKARAFRTGGVVWDSIQCFLITHGHLDHIAGLVISSALCRPEVKPVYGVEHTVANLERAMDGGVWPVLGAREGGKERGAAYQYRVFEAPSTRPRALSPSLSFTAFPVAHGPDPSASASSSPSTPGSDPAMSLPRGDGVSVLPDAKDVYCSTAVFIKDDESGREFLFFGDVEPDSVSGTDLNRRVWAAAAQKIVDRTLDTVFIECSYPSSQARELLFGHLSPPFLMEELETLAESVRACRGPLAATSTPDRTDRPLDGVTVVVIHIKDELYPPSLPRAPQPQPDTVTTAAEAASLAVVEPVSASRPRRSPRLESSRFAIASPGALPAVTSDVGFAGEEEAEEEEETVQERIERELNELERARGTGVEFVLARQGMRIEF